jgi:hypothetical protein
MNSRSRVYKSPSLSLSSSFSLLLYLKGSQHVPVFLELNELLLLLPNGVDWGSSAFKGRDDTCNAAVTCWDMANGRSGIILWISSSSLSGVR